MTPNILDIPETAPFEGWKRQRSSKELRRFVNQHLAKLDFEKLDFEDLEP